ncbi:MAG: HDIG domain-containing protein [Candidatus Woesearchaeota archaeon]
MTEKPTENTREEIPTRDECMAMLKEHEVPENVIRHTLAVNKVAVFLARKLKEAGEDVDVELVDRASLLHDIDKIETLGTGEHGSRAEELLSDKGYVKIGRIIKKHVFRAIYDQGLDTWEEKIVNYADKRCTEDKLVSLDERFAYGRERYAHELDEKTKEIEGMYYDLEKDIFRRIGMNPDDLRWALSGNKGEKTGAEKGAEKD